MKVKKKGISSILGALIFLQILLISMLLIIHVINNETNITLKSVQRIQALSEYAPISENVENDTTYLYSTSTFTITHVIYPNGEIRNTSILVKNKVSVSQILNGFPWAIIVTSQGTWYNVSLLGEGNGDQGVITFPNYKDYGEPLNGSLGLVSGSPNWNTIEGISSPSPLSLVPVNVTVGDPTTYYWALTDAVLEAHPPSSDGWINITYYTPIRSAVDGWSVPPPPWWDPSWPWTDYGYYYAYNYTQGSLGIYVPLNISWSMGFMQFQTGQNIYSWAWLPTNIIINSTTMEYTYIYLHSGEKTITQVYQDNSWWNSPPYIQAGAGTMAGYWYPNWSYCLNYIHFPSYPINSLVGNNILSNFSLPSYSYIPRITAITKLLTTTNGAPYNAFLSKRIPLYFPTITVYQADINLNKGEILYYGYLSSNNSWLLLNYLKYNYRYPVTYSSPIYNQNPFNPIQTLVWVVPNWHGGYNIVPRVGPTPPGAMTGDIYFRNINDIQYITSYPIYIAIPSGTYVLQVNLS